MTIETSTWNLLLVGGWNRAILTPHGVAQKLFRLDPGTPVDVEVAIDSLNTLRVSHDGVKVIASANSLEIIASEQTFDCLVKAKKVASNALNSLPATPVAGAGINIRYIDESPPETLVQMIECELDKRMIDNKFDLENRRYFRAAKFNDGLLNVDLNIGSGGHCDILLNFHMASNSTSVLKDWVDQPIEPIHDKAILLVSEVFGMEINND